jgi:hypothetical protein
MAPWRSCTERGGFHPPPRVYGARTSSPATWKPNSSDNRMTISRSCTCTPAERTSRSSPALHARARAVLPGSSGRAGAPRRAAAPRETADSGRGEGGVMACSARICGPGACLEREVVREVAALRGRRRAPVLGAPTSAAGRWEVDTACASAKARRQLLTSCCMIILRAASKRCRISHALPILRARPARARVVGSLSTRVA